MLLTGLRALLAGQRHVTQTVLSVYHKRWWDRLREGAIDGLSGGKPDFEFVGFDDRAYFDAVSACGAFLLINEPCLAADRHIEIADVSGYLLDFTVRQ
jgi:hypothetical protein